jgi:2-polyprenyl-6-methoxyphenol hydroxylase-like FAD-dependent oxidoreductase
MIFDVGPFVLEGGVPTANQGRGGFCPRRMVLDQLLVNGAVESGAELREGFTVTELLWKDDRVTGIRGRSQGGALVDEHARVVIGADGVHSFVAKAVGAQEYDAKPPIATYYYSYYSDFDAHDIEQHVRDYYGIGCFPTHDALTLVAVVWPSRCFEAVRADIEGHVRNAHESVPKVADRMRAARRVERWSGTAGVANYFRRPYGSGWALVGDAGHDKDPLTAQGMSDAFLDAEALATALDDGWAGRRLLDGALAYCHFERDRRARPMYEFTCELARLEPAPPHMRELFAALAGNRDATEQFYAALTGAVPLPEFMNPENIGRIVGSRVT